MKFRSPKDSGVAKKINGRKQGSSFSDNKTPENFQGAMSDRFLPSCSRGEDGQKKIVNKSSDKSKKTNFCRCENWKNSGEAESSCKGCGQRRFQRQERPGQLDQRHRYSKETSDLNLRESRVFRCERSEEKAQNRRCDESSKADRRNTGCEASQKERQNGIQGRWRERPQSDSKSNFQAAKQVKKEADFATKIFPVFVVVAPGLESLANFELRRIGIHNPRSELGGVTFHGTMADVWKANLWSRIAERILVRISSFEASGFGQLENGAARIAWKRWIRPGAKVALSVTCHASKLYHSGAVAQRFEDVIRTAVVGSRIIGMAEAEETELNDKAGFGGVVQRVYVRLDSDHCIVSLDSSGALLHRRGYRQDVTRAPLRETLAAALVLCAGLQNMVPGLARVSNSSEDERGAKPFSWLLDPMCGSGTIPLEAARLVCNVAPGCARRFAFQNWPGHDAAAWSTLREEAISRRISPPDGFLIEGRDVDPEAIEAAKVNAGRAKIPEGLIRWSILPVESTEVREGRGVLVSNPPYGHRLGDEVELRRFFSDFGKKLRSACAGSHFALLLPDGADFQKVFGLSSECKTSFKNGGLPVGIWTGDFPGRTD